MVQITFVEPSGNQIDIDVSDGWSLMQAAIANGVDGIVAECGGSCVCATCHCLVIEAPGGIEAIGEAERDTLEFTSDAMQASSRLTCQIAVTEALEGAVFQVVGH